MDDRYRVEESTVLLHAIFPRYPDLRGMRPIPDPKQFLQELRQKQTPENKNG